MEKLQQTEYEQQPLADIEQLILKYEQRYNLTSQGILINRLDTLLQLHTDSGDRLKSFRQILNRELPYWEHQLGIKSTSLDKNPEDRALESLRQFATQHKALVETLTSVLHTLTAIREMEQQMNDSSNYSDGWTHRDRKAVANLVIAMIDNRLQRVGFRGIPEGAQELTARYSDVEF